MLLTHLWAFSVNCSIILSIIFYLSFLPLFILPHLFHPPYFYNYILMQSSLKWQLLNMNTLKEKNSNNKNVSEIYKCMHHTGLYIDA